MLRGPSVHQSLAVSCSARDQVAARVVKGRIEQTFLRDIVYWIEDVWSAEGSYLSLKIDFETIGRLQLDINAKDIMTAIRKQKKFKLGFSDTKCWKDHIYISVRPVDSGKSLKARPRDDTDIFLRVQNIKRALPNIPICGYPEASRAIIKSDEKTQNNSLLVEGYGLRACMTTEGVNGLATKPTLSWRCEMCSA
jgi:DNA-directed RNA polymerase III subunit RPC1